MPNSIVATATDSEQLIQDTMSALLALDGIRLRQLMASAGEPAINFAEGILVPALDRLGDRWQLGAVSLAQVYMSGRFCERLLDEALPAGEVPRWPTPPIAVAVLEDFHVLGKRLLCSVLRAGGYPFVDYGPISVDDLILRVQADGIRILLISTLMLNSALRVARVREKLTQAGHEISIVVGGAPFRFDPGLAREVGAYATSPTATGVIAIIGGLTQGVDHAN